MEYLFVTNPEPSSSQLFQDGQFGKQDRLHFCNNSQPTDNTYTQIS